MQQESKLAYQGDLKPKCQPCASSATACRGVRQGYLSPQDAPVGLLLGTVVCLETVFRVLQGLSGWHVQALSSPDSAAP